MRSQLAFPLMSLVLFISASGFSATLLTNESAPKIDLKMNYLSFKKGQPIKSLGKFIVNGREMTCRMGEQSALEQPTTLEASQLKNVALVSHFPDKGIVHLSVSGEKNADMPVQMECRYQAIPGKKAPKSPLSVEDFQAYFNQRAEQQKMISDGLKAMIEAMPIYLNSKVMKSYPRYVGSNEAAAADESLTEDSNPQICPALDAEEKLSDKLMQRCTPNTKPRTLIFQGHVKADGSSQPIGER